MYTSVAMRLAQTMTEDYSTSFSLSSRLFPKGVRRGIYGIYGLVRLADEVVDTFELPDKRVTLDALEAETYASMESGVSVNPIVHAFAVTARQYGIATDLVRPFFESMRTDLEPVTYTQELYERYIYGSAEVIGCMCLKVFVNGNKERYEQLRAGAGALGAAYQKVNFLRDLREDYQTRGRMYFPGMQFETFSEVNKQAIVSDIEQDFAAAKLAIQHLPSSVKPAVITSYQYYTTLLKKLKVLPPQTIKQQRVRVADGYKLWLFVLAMVKRVVS